MAKNEKAGESGAASRPGLPTRPAGVSIIAGAQSDRGNADFHAINQITGEKLFPDMACASKRDVDHAASAAWTAFTEARGYTPERFADLLHAVAANITSIEEALIQLAGLETGLPADRLRAEMARTVGTLRMFASIVHEGSWVEAMIDRPEARDRPVANHDVRRMLLPLGPAAVFTASNFPLAYGVAGTDTASALAAGCPVVVKGHPLYPGTGELVGVCVADAVRRTSFPSGWFSYLHSGGDREREVGAALVVHPCIRAAGFTGSRRGGTALAALAAARPDPIPFFAEMGAVNPVVVLPGALETEPEKIARTLALSIAAATGQQCTCPGLIMIVDGPGMDAFVSALVAALEAVEPAPMLGPEIHANYMRAVREVMAVEGVEVISGKDNVPAPLPPGRSTHKPPVTAAPVLLRCQGSVFGDEPTLSEEMFGPAAMIVRCGSLRELADACGAVLGSLTCSVFVGGSDREIALRLAPVLEQRCGRLVFNGVPTGVDVAWSMVHGGPFPATNRPDTSAVGPTAMWRWRRPVCFQNAPPELLPQELADENPLGIERLVDGVRTRGML